MTSLRIVQDRAADALLSSDFFALLVGMTLDQQFPMEAAFAGPHKIAERMDGFDVHRIAEANLDDFIELCSQTPAIHRFPKSMAQRIHQIAHVVVDHYEGDTELIWTRDSPDGKAVVERLMALPGWGEHKATIFLALLGKQLGVRPPGWESAAGDYAEPGSTRSVADVVDPDSLQRVREFKKAQKARSAGIRAGSRDGNKGMRST